MEHSRNCLGKASVLAIGTELTTGQVTNRNAAWISQQLTDLGVEVVLHQTVADDRPRMLAALQACSQESQFIFVTGGLGPTTDDFTREVIADWLKKPLQFNSGAWQAIVDRLQGLKIPNAESNRQQCFFPEGSEIIPNPEGTAAGFTSETAQLHQRLWVLPGPPREVSAVWGQGVVSRLRQALPNPDPVRLLTWQCLGKSEAELGEITEKALEGSGLKTGYRAHRPFVEIKVWCPEKLLSQMQPALEALEKAIAPWIHARQGEDLGVRFIQSTHSQVLIKDFSTGGVLAARLRFIQYGTLMTSETLKILHGDFRLLI